MATKTDLQGMLRNDDPSFSSLLHDFFGKADLQWPCRVVARWKASGTSSEEQIAILPVQHPGKNKSVNVNVLLEGLEQAILPKIGATPVGTMRLRANSNGRSGSPEVDMQRTLIVTGETGDTADTTLLKHRLACVERQNEQLHTLLVTLSVGAHTSAAQLAQANAQLSGVRTATASAHDVGNVGTLAILGGLLVMLPAIKEQLGVPKNASVADMIKYAQYKVMKTFEADQADERPVEQEERAPAPPEGQRSSVHGLLTGPSSGAADGPADSSGTSPTPEAPAASPAIDDVQAIIDRMESDQAWRESLFQAALRRPAVADQVKLMAMQALSS